MSWNTADRLIKIKDFADQNRQFGDFAGSLHKSTQYLIVEPSTPEEAREEILERAASGEPIPPSKAKAIVDRHKPPAEPLEAEVVITTNSRGMILKAELLQGNYGPSPFPTDKSKL